MTSIKPLDIIVVDKNSTLKVLSIKDFKEEELFKKCGFKKADDFKKQVDWNVKYDGKKFVISVFGKTEGRANNENKYDFPPPIDTKLFFGSCAILAKMKISDGVNGSGYTDLSLAMWGKIYEKLFGGFEDLKNTAQEDEEEEDELALVPKDKKTKHGYLKDGFVVDDSADDEEDEDSDSEEDSDELLEMEDSEENTEDEENLVLEDIGSELSEEEYDYSDDEEEDDKKIKMKGSN